MKLFLATLLMTSMSWATSQSDMVNQLSQQSIQAVLSGVEPLNLINWKKGDTCNYDLQVSIAKGSMSLVVRDITSEGIWLDQNMDIAFQKMTGSTLIDPATGQIKRIVVKGKDQEIPDPADQQIVETKEDKLTVPAGTFDCIYAKINDKKKNEQSEMWINPEAVPLTGMIQTIAPTPLGKMTAKLKSFKRN